MELAMADELEAAPLKQCRDCRDWFPATVAHFYRSRREKNGVQGLCRGCDRIRQKERRDLKQKPVKIDWDGLVSPEFAETIPHGHERFGKFCGYCLDLPHRRAKPACRGCDEPWEPDNWRADIDQ